MSGRRNRCARASAGDDILSTLQLSRRGAAGTSASDHDGTVYVSVSPARQPGQGGGAHDDDGSKSARGLERVEMGAVMRQVRRSVVVRRNERGLGIDVDERNTLVRILPGSAAEDDGQGGDGLHVHVEVEAPVPVALGGLSEVAPAERPATVQRGALPKLNDGWRYRVAPILVRSRSRSFSRSCHCFQAGVRLGMSNDALLRW